MDWFAGALHDESQLAQLYEPASALVQNKTIDHLDHHCRAYLAACGFVLLASADSQGRADQVRTHCPKAFVCSGLWEPASWPAKGDHPSPAEMLRDHVGDPALTLAAAEQAMVDAVTVHLP